MYIQKEFNALQILFDVHSIEYGIRKKRNALFKLIYLHFDLVIKHSF